MTSASITPTDERLLQAFRRTEIISSNTIINKQSSTKNTFDVQLGTITRFYYEWDRAEVKLNGETRLCRLTHPTTGNCDIFFTPFGDLKWDEKRRKTYFSPLSKCECIVLLIDGETPFILSYYFSELTGPLPTINDGGVLHIRSYGDSVQIGGNNGGITLDTSQIIFKDWADSEQRNPVNTADITEDNVLNKEYYTKEEVDSLLQELRDEFNTKLEEEENGTTS